MAIAKGKSIELESSRLVRAFNAVWAALCGLYVFGWSTVWTFRDPYPRVIGTWRGIDGFFTAQADAILHLRLDIGTDVPWFRNLGSECFVRDGKCFGYFGIVPSLIRIPFLLIFGKSNFSYAPIFLALGAAISIWCALDLVRRALSRLRLVRRSTRACVIILAGLCLGPGSVLVMLSDPYMYQEAIMWSIAGSMVAINLLWRWWNERRIWQLTGATVAAVFSAGSRPTSVGFGVVVAIGFSWLLWRRSELNRSLVVRLAMLAALPVLFTFGVFYLKFGSPFLSYSLYASKNETLLELNDGTETGPRFIPTAAFMYLRPDAVRFSQEWPFVRFRFGDTRDGFEPPKYLPPLRENSMYVEETTSLTSSMPLASLAIIVGVAASALTRRRHELVLLGAAATIGVVMMLGWGLTTRYLCDMYPFVALGAVCAVASVPKIDSWSRRTRYSAAAGAFLASAYSIGVMVSLITRYAWIWE